MQLLGQPRHTPAPDLISTLFSNPGEGSLETPWQSCVVLAASSVEQLLCIALSILYLLKLNSNGNILPYRLIVIT
jgi:hypothetical protein